MKHKYLFLLLIFCGLDVAGQSIIYANLRSLQSGEGDTVAIQQEIIVQRRTRNQRMLSGGADYRLTSEARSINRRLRSALAVRVDSALFVNCHRMRYKKLSFGKNYAPAIQYNSSVFFSAIPLGNVADRFTKHEHQLGELGDAITSSAVLNIRVCYELNLLTGNITFVDRQRLKVLLQPYSDLILAYLAENSEEAHTVWKYLSQLKRRAQQR